ncbi:unnamed protein product [Caenorhabditis sp. 36 PRJEB53466]|nr:unnamed protein product [Caenorhabditis sp. 36 PRJEB53466]
MSGNVEIKEETVENDDFVIDRNPVPLAFCAHPTSKSAKNQLQAGDSDVLEAFLDGIVPIKIDNPSEIRRAESLKSYGGDTESEFEFSGDDEDLEQELRDLRAGNGDSDEEFDRFVRVSAKIIQKTHRAEWDHGDDGNARKTNKKSYKTTNVHEYDDLPPIESLSIECKSSLIEFGLVTKRVDCVVVIESTSTEVLDFDSFLFRQNGTAIGQIYDIFGQVKNPQYAIRFNSPTEAAELEIGTKVYYAPNEEQFSKTPFKGLNLAAANREALSTLNRRLDHQEAVAKAIANGQNAECVGGGDSDIEFSDDEVEKEYKRIKGSNPTRHGAGGPNFGGNRGGRKRDLRGRQQVRFADAPRGMTQHFAPPKPYRRDFDVEMAPAAPAPVPVAQSGPEAPPAQFDNPYAEFGCYSGFNGRFGI